MTTSDEALLEIVRDPAVFARRVLDQPLWDHQLEVVRSTARYRVLNAGRRAGKTRVFGVLALHLMYTRPGAKVLMVSAGEASVKRTHSEIAAMARGSVGGSSVEDDNVMTLTLSNGSQLESVTASVRAARSAEADLLIVDEAGFVANEVWQAAEPVVGARPGARVILASTPWMGAGHFFHDLWRQGMDAPDAEVESWHWPSSISPLVDKAWLEAVRGRSASDYFEREYEAEWTGAEGAFFSEAELMGAVASYPLIDPGQALTVDGGAGWGGASVPVFEAVAGIDWGFNRDANALVLLAGLEDFGLNDEKLGDGGRALFVPWLEARHRWAYSDFIDRVVEVAGGYALQVVASERNGVGAYPTQDLQARVQRSDLVVRPWVRPIWTDARRKQTGFGKIKGLLQRGRLVLPNEPELLKQLRALEYAQTESGLTKIAVPERSGHDDLAMALLQAVSCVTQQGPRWSFGDMLMDEQELRRIRRAYEQSRARHRAAVDDGSLQVVETGSGLRVPVEALPMRDGVRWWRLPEGGESGDGW